MVAASLVPEKPLLPLLLSRVFHGRQKSPIFAKTVDPGPRAELVIVHRVVRVLDRILGQIPVSERVVMTLD